MKILKFLNKCFRTTNTIIQMETNRMLDVSNTYTKSIFFTSFTFEELQEAQIEINRLLYVINERINLLQEWIPPTMPFLNF